MEYLLNEGLVYSTIVIIIIFITKEFSKIKYDYERAMDVDSGIDPKKLFNKYLMKAILYFIVGIVVMVIGLINFINKLSL